MMIKSLIGISNIITYILQPFKTGDLLLLQINQVKDKLSESVTRGQAQPKMAHL